MLFASSNPETTLSVSTKWTIVFGRGLTGFAIGISALRMSWWLHGIVLGLIGSIPMAIPVMERPEIAVGTFVMGAIYGFLTELITTIVFKAKSAGAAA
jgi:hypothetical protein